ncbi:MAG: hypothetical protein V4628_07315 [Pseudomonadota bacterium]
MKTSMLAFHLAGGLMCAMTFAQDTPVIPEFAAIDKDKDGALSITEARLLFPSLVITDVEMDGLLSKKEAELALPGLVYSNDNHEDDNTIVGPEEYALMAEQYLLAAQEETAN